MTENTVKIKKKNVWSEAECDRYERWHSDLIGLERIIVTIVLNSVFTGYDATLIKTLGTLLMLNSFDWDCSYHYDRERILKAVSFIGDKMAVNLSRADHDVISRKVSKVNDDRLKLELTFFIPRDSRMTKKQALDKTVELIANIPNNLARLEELEVNELKGIADKYKAENKRFADFLDYEGRGILTKRILEQMYSYYGQKQSFNSWYKKREYSAYRIEANDIWDLSAELGQSLKEIDRKVVK